MGAMIVAWECECEWLFDDNPILTCAVFVCEGVVDNGVAESTSESLSS